VTGPAGKGASAPTGVLHIYFYIAAAMERGEEKKGEKTKAGILSGLRSGRMADRYFNKKVVGRKEIRERGSIS